MTPDPGFKVTVVLKGKYLQSDAFYRHSYYKDVIVHHRHAIKVAIQLTTTPLLLRKPCKLFAGVAWVCRRQLGFLVYMQFCLQVVLHRLSQWQKVWTLSAPCEGTVVAALAWRPDGKGKSFNMHMSLCSSIFFGCL